MTQFIKEHVDLLVQLVLFAATVLYLASLPHNLGYADESYFLYESKRISEGEVLYRDVFQYVTPLSPYVMALLFRLFGTTIATARVSTAVLHGLIVMLAYAGARTLHVARSLAAVVALAHVAIAEPAWPFASWHWFSSCVAAGILLVLVRVNGIPSPTRTFGLGVLGGLLIGVQQQRGVIPTLGVGVFFLIDQLIDRWYGERPLWRSAAARLALFAVGVALVVVPMLLTFVYLAGAEPVYHALIRFPLENYRTSFRTGWGGLTVLTANYGAHTFPRFLRALPAVLALPLVCLVAALARRHDRARVRQLTALLLFAAVSALSIWYYPDFIHIAFIAVPFFVGAGLAMQWMLDAAPLPLFAARTLGRIIGLVAAAALVGHLGVNMTRKGNQYPYSHPTAFGRVDFASLAETRLIDVLRERLKEGPSQEIFCYPNLASPYLTTGGKNPTRFQHFSAWVFPRGDIEQVLATLVERRVPYIVAVLLALRPDDPIAQLIHRDYEAVDLSDGTGGPLPGLWLFQRKEGER